MDTNNISSIDYLDPLIEQLIPLIRWRSWTSTEHIGICAPQSVSTSTTIEETQSRVRRILAENPALAEPGIIRTAIEMASIRIAAELPDVPRADTLRDEKKQTSIQVLADGSKRFVIHLTDGRVHDISNLHSLQRGSPWKLLSGPLRHLARPKILRFRHEHVIKHNGVCAKCGTPHTRVEDLDVEYVIPFEELQARWAEGTIQHEIEWIKAQPCEADTPPHLKDFTLDMLLKSPLATWGPAGVEPKKESARGWKRLVEDYDLENLERQFDIPRLGDVLGAWTTGNGERIEEVIEHWVGTFLQPDLEYRPDQHAEAEVFYRYSTKNRDSREEGRIYLTLGAALGAEGGASFEDALRDGLRFGLIPWCWFYREDLSTNPKHQRQTVVYLLSGPGDRKQTGKGERVNAAAPLSPGKRRRIR